MQGLGAPERMHFMPLLARQGVGFPTPPTLAETHDTTSIELTVTEPTSWGTGTGKAYTLQSGTDGIYWPTSENLTYPQTTIDKTGLTPGSVHWYRIGAVTSLGTRWSNELKVTLDTLIPGSEASISDIWWMEPWRMVVPFVSGAQSTRQLVAQP